MTYHILNTKKEIEELISDLSNRSEFAFDTETTGLETHSRDFKLVGLGFAYENKSYYVPFNGSHGISYDDLLKSFKDLLEDPIIEKIGQNIKYDARALHSQGINLRGIKFDNYVAHYCLYSDRFSHNLDDISLHHLNLIKTRTRDVIPKATKEKNLTMWDADTTIVGNYCCEDAEATFELYKYFKHLFTLEEHKHAKELFYNIELPLLPVLIDMECSGVCIDVDYLDKIRQRIALKIDIYNKFIEKTIGKPLAVTNPNSIETVIYDDLKVQDENDVLIPTTDKGKRKTDKDTLAIFGSNKVVKAILLIKKYNKLLNTYIIAIPEKISPITGFIHASFNQCITATGRLSSSDPNLQNIPSRDLTGKKIRKSFTSRWAKQGGRILAADYSQAELRILAHISLDKTLLEAYENKEDVHSKVAKLLEAEPELLNMGVKIQRFTAKTINFGIIYGMGAKKLAKTLSVLPKVAEKIIEKYLLSMPGIKKFIEHSEDFLKTYGYTQTIFGRRRYIPKVYSSELFDVLAAKREGMNHCVQGANADIIKIAMVNIHNKLKSLNLKSLLILQVHDEIVLDVYPSEIDIVTKIVTKAMETAVTLKVPMVADAKLANNWAEAH